jgi:hypothetical protein
MKADNLNIMARQVERDLVTRVESGLKLLLESKHLYQKVLLDFGEILGRVEPISVFGDYYNRRVEGRWLVLDAAAAPNKQPEPLPSVLVFSAPHLKLFLPHL